MTNKEAMNFLKALGLDEIGKPYKKIQKKLARRLWNEGKDIYFIPCKFCFSFNDPFCVTNKEKTNEDFDKFCNHFTYYNCSNETGRYIHFYCKIEDYKPKR